MKKTTETKAGELEINTLYFEIFFSQLLKFKTGLYIRIPKAASCSILEIVNRESTLLYHDGFMYHRKCPRLASSAKKLYGDARFDKLFKFSVVRNPFARAVSCWQYLTNHPEWNKLPHFEPTSFNEFCYKLVSTENDDKNHTYDTSCCNHYSWHTQPQFEHLYDSTGKLLIDYVGKVETLQSDLDNILDRLELPRRQIKNINKTSHRHYTEYYDDETREIIEKKYAKDIEYFGYEFGK